MTHLFACSYINRCLLHLYTGHSVCLVATEDIDLSVAEDYGWDCGDSTILHGRSR